LSSYEVDDNTSDKAAVGKLNSIAPRRESHVLQGLVAIVAAPFVGSFLGSVVRRMPVGTSVVAGRSRCDHCGAALAARDLVPIASWVVTGGHCRSCGARLGWFYPAIEVAAILVAVACVLVDGNEPVRLWIDCLLGWALLTIAWIDIEHLILPDILTLPLLLAGLAVTYGEAPEDITDHALAAAVGYLGFRAIAFLYRRLRGRDGLGEGDAKLLAAGGAWLGLLSLDWLVLAAAAIGLIGAAAAWVAGHRLEASSALPFGAALALALFALRLLS
jgi:leader peptidase (prepilin peptidase) / N-methyltransferase